MADSDSTAKPSEDTGANHFRGGMTRALLSAVVFGAMGAYFGKWLGKRGNCDKGQMAEPIMKWSMGAFWAVLAAYSSLKAGERVDEKPAPVTTAGVTGYLLPSDAMAVSQNVTHPHALVAAAKHEGLLQEKPLHMAAQK